MPEIKYSLRDKLHNPKGEYTEAQILHRIEKGKYTGDEQVAFGPDLHWRRISSIPVFYDAFVKRLHALGLYSPQDPPPPTTGFSIPDSGQVEEALPATRQEAMATAVGGIGDKGEAADEGAANGANETRQEGGGHGKTIHQSEIDRLFTGKSIPPLEADSPELPEMVIPPEEKPEVSLKEDLERRSLFEKVKDGSAKSPRRTIAITLGLTALVFVFLFSGEAPPPTTPGPNEHLLAVSAAVQQAYPTDESQSDPVFLAQQLAEEYGKGETLPGLKEAAKLYETVIASGPKVATPYASRAVALARILEAHPDDESVVADLKRTIAAGREWGPHQPEFYQAETLAALFQGKMDEARAFSQKALEVDPLGAETFLVLGELILKEGNAEEALRTLAAVEKNLSANFRAQLLMAKAQFAAGQFDLAQASASRAALANPLNAEAYSIMGDIYAKKNLLKQARLAFEVAAKLSPFTRPGLSAFNHYRYASLSGTTGKEKDTAAHYYMAYRLDPKSYSEFKDKLGGAEAEEAAVRLINEQFYYDKDYLLGRAQDLTENRRFADAGKYLLGLTLLYPQASDVFVRFGEVIERIGRSFDDYRYARVLYLKGHSVNPSDPVPLIHLGELETSQYNFDRAIAILSAADALAEDNLEVQLALGRHFFKRQDFKASEEHFRSAQMLNPANAEVYYFQGLLYRKLQPDNVRDAMRLFYDAYLRDPQNYAALSEWLKLKVLTFDKIFAIKFIRNLIEMDAKNANLYWVFGEIYAANKEFLRAVTQYHRSLDLDNTSSRVRVSLAGALRAVGRLDDAVAEYRLSSELDNKNGEGYFEAASILYDAKNFAAAEQNLSLLLKMVPGYPAGRRLRSKVYQAMGKKDAAVDEMKAEVVANPFNYRYTIELAELYMEYLKYDEAVKELTKVSTLSVDSKTPASIRNEKIRSLLLLSRCYRAQNSAETAEGAIKLALSMDSGDPELHREMGYVYHALKRHREAASSFKTYLDRNPAARDADAVRRIISQTVIEE